MKTPFAKGALSRWLPAAAWLSSYDRRVLGQDSFAALIVTLMLIPQSLAYAMLAGLPPQVGLYASILPLVAYAAFGSSRTLSVGPVAVASLMTATAIADVAAAGTAAYLQAAVVLALLSGLVLLAMATLRLGLLANFLSHPVISGFISASAILIAFGQLKHLLGVSFSGATVPEIGRGLWAARDHIHLPTLLIGALATAGLRVRRAGSGGRGRGAGLGRADRRRRAARGTAERSPWPAFPVERAGGGDFREHRSLRSGGR